MAQRRITKFESKDGTISYTFPDVDGQQSIEQQYRVPMSMALGANYAHDHLAGGVSPKDPRRIALAALHWEDNATNLAAEKDEAEAECYRIGEGYLYRVEPDGTTFRRCLARLTSAPGITIALQSEFGVEATLFNFVGNSDWMATAAQSGSQTLAASPTLVSITNPGNLDCLDVTYTLTALAAAGFSAPSIYNATTGERVSTTRVAGDEGEVWRVRGGAWAVERDLSPGFEIGFSFVGQGGIGPEDYENDYSLASITGAPPRLKPGVNQLLIEGATNATFAYSYTPRYV